MNYKAAFSFLRKSESLVFSKLISLTNEDFSKKIDDSWTVSQNFIHILEIEKLIFESATTVDSETKIEDKSEQIKYLILESNRKFNAPDMFQPKQEFISIEDFIDSNKKSPI